MKRKHWVLSLLSAVSLSSTGSAQVPVTVHPQGSDLSRPLPSVIQSAAPSLVSQPSWTMPVTTAQQSCASCAPASPVLTRPYPIMPMMAAAPLSCAQGACGVPYRGNLFERLKNWLTFNPCSQYPTFRVAPYYAPVQTYFPKNPQPLGWGVAATCGEQNCGLLGITGPGGSVPAPRTPLFPRLQLPTAPVGTFPAAPSYPVSMAGPRLIHTPLMPSSYGMWDGGVTCDRPRFLERLLGLFRMPTLGGCRTRPTVAAAVCGPAVFFNNPHTATSEYHYAQPEAVMGTPVAQPQPQTMPQPMPMTMPLSTLPSVRYPGGPVSQTGSVLRPFAQ
jgi:hypothetical protein